MNSFAIVCLNSQVFADESPPGIANHDVRDEIASSAYWLKLVHYKKSWSGFGYESEITDAAFFLSEQGRDSPLQELIATVNAFKTDAMQVCRFPARYYWLSRQYGKQLNLEEGGLANCSELQEWNKHINPGSASLIFPAAYLNGPSSMFGHTLLRIDPADERKDLPLVAYAINYAANVQDVDNNVAFAFNGIFGGYPGVMSIVPYHEKIKEYGEIENRDIWEYRLNLDRSEISQMLRHAWELKDLRSAYYFFTLNCSYLILNLIEVAREDISLTNQFGFKVIPVDTVRAVVASGLVSETVYRASAATLLSQRYETLNPDEQSQLKQIVDTQPDLTNYNVENPNQIEHARILELAFDTFRYRANQTPSERDANAAYNLQLLKTRSKISVKDIWPEIIRPKFKPEQGHKSGRLAVGYRHTETSDNGLNDVFFKIRPAYHDLLDPGKGFPAGAQINFLDLMLSYNREDDEARIESWTFIDILSLTPSHDLFDPVSWRVDFSYDKLRAGNEDIDVLQVSPGFGKSSLANKNILGYALLNASLEYSVDYKNNYGLGVGVLTGILLTQPQYSGRLEFESSRLFAGQTDTRFSLSISAAWHIDTNLSLRLGFEREKLFEQYINSQQLALNWYF